jgi:prepilin-type N-terminal cleavage/methylation domain-containing protein
MDIKSKKGVTLVEVIAAVTIMAIILVPVSLVFITAYSNFIGQSDKVAAQQSAREVLYGKGFSSYGIMGDLERSSANSENITIEDFIDEHMPDKGGRSILIKESTTEVSGTTKVIRYTYYDDKGVLYYKEKEATTDINYFDNEKSSNDHEVNVTGFEAVKITKGTVIDATTGIKTDTDMIKIIVTVACGRSGNVTLQSSYRIPNTEK